MRKRAEVQAEVLSIRRLEGSCRKWGTVKVGVIVVLTDRRNSAETSSGHHASKAFAEKRSL